jgi:alkylation response protein AidB-like acyl-CoA dehydrogenase
VRRSGPKPHLAATAANGRDHVERYFREIQIARIAPISPQLILSHIAERVLGLPKSY